MGQNLEALLGENVPCSQLPKNFGLTKSEISSTTSNQNELSSSDTDGGCLDK